VSSAEPQLSLNIFVNIKKNLRIEYTGNIQEKAQLSVHKSSFNLFRQKMYGTGMCRYLRGRLLEFVVVIV
jgi:hypothetical protein